MPYYVRLALYFVCFCCIVHVIFLSEKVVHVYFLSIIIKSTNLFY